MDWLSFYVQNMSKPAESQNTNGTGIRFQHSLPTAPKWVPIWGPGSPWGPFSVFGSPKGPHFLSKVPIFLFQAEERAKSQSSHCLLNVDHLNTCDDKTSLNEYHASLSVKLNFVL